MIPFTPKTTGMIPFTPGQLPKVAPTLTNAQKGAKEALDMPKNIAPALGGSIKNAFTGGVSQTKEGYNEAKNAKNPLQLLEGGIKEASGVASMVTSPLAPVGEAINNTIVKPTSDLISNIPIVQKFANSKLGKATAKGAEVTGNLANITGTIAGGMDIAGKIPPAEDIMTKGSDVATKASKKLQNTFEGTTPAKLNDYIDKQYSKAIPSSSKKSVALTENQLANNRESMKLITDNKDNLKFSNQAGTYDTGRLPENIAEHAQAVTQTRQAIWDRMSNMLKDKNVSISLDKPLSMIKAKMTQLGESASEYPYLKALYDKYSKTPMATTDQMNTFIKDLNNDAEPFFKSGSDKAKATASASVGNLFRDQLDTTAQQIGTPEVSLLRKQYGAMASTEADIAKALNKQLKGDGGGASGLADLFSGEEIARGIITGNPESMVSGLSLQATKKFLKFLNDPNRAIKNLYSTIEDVSSKGGVPRMTSSFATKDRAGLPMVKGNPNTVETPGVINLPGKIGGFDEPQAKNIGVGLNPPKEVKVGNGVGTMYGAGTYGDFNPEFFYINGQKLSEMKSVPKGNYINVGMNVGQTAEKISPQIAKDALPKDIKIIGKPALIKVDGEMSWQPNLSRPLTPTEITKYLKDTKQIDIPQYISEGEKLGGSVKDASLKVKRVKK